MNNPERVIGKIVTRTLSGYYILRLEGYSGGEEMVALPVASFHRQKFEPEMTDAWGFLKEGVSVQLIKKVGSWQPYTDSLSREQLGPGRNTVFISTDTPFFEIAQHVAALNNSYPVSIGHIYLGFDEEGKIVGIDEEISVEDYAAELKAHLRVALDSTEFVDNNIVISEETTHNGLRYFHIRIMPRERILCVFNIYIYSRTNEGKTLLLKNSEIADAIIRRC